MLDRYEQSLRVLGLAPGATEQAIKDAYRDLIKVWHPDRFGSDARLRAKAEDKLKELNAAFDQLRGYRTPRDSGSTREPVPLSPRDPAPPIDRANYRLAAYALALLLALLAGIVGVVLFMSIRGASEARPPADEPIEAPASANPARVPAAPQPARRGAAAPQSPGVPTTGSLRVVSQPIGARVSFDGRAIGETPIVVTDITPGEHQIALALDAEGYHPWSSSVVVTAGQEEKLLAVMTPTKRPR